MHALSSFTALSISEAEGFFGKGILHPEAVQVFLSKDPRIEEGGYLELLGTGQFYCCVCHSEILHFDASKVVDFLVENYPA